MTIPNGIAARRFQDQCVNYRRVRIRLTAPSGPIKGIPTSLVTGQKEITAATADDVFAERLLTLRKKQYAKGEEYIRRQVAGLINGVQPVELFSRGMAEALKGPVPPDLQAMVKGLGPLQSIRFLRVDPMGTDEYEVTFEKGAYIWVLGVDGNDKILMSFFRPR